MKSQYKVSLFLLILSQVIFFILAAYHTDRQIYYPEDPTAIPTIGYSWIWYHPEHWLISLILAIIAITFFLYAAVLDLKKLGRKEL